MNTPEGSPDKDNARKKRDNSLSGLILLSNLPALIALVAYLIWRYWP